MTKVAKLKLAAVITLCVLAAAQYLYADPFGTVVDCYVAYGCGPEYWDCIDNYCHSDCGCDWQDPAWVCQGQTQLDCRDECFNWSHYFC